MSTEPLRIVALEHVVKQHIDEHDRLHRQILSKLAEIYDAVTGTLTIPGLGETQRHLQAEQLRLAESQLAQGAHLERVDVAIRALQDAPANDLLEESRLVHRTGVVEVVKHVIGSLPIAGAILFAAFKGWIGGHP